jgi:hypothetical protein
LRVTWPADRVVLEPLDHVGQPVRQAVDVGIVDLVGVTRDASIFVPSPARVSTVFTSCGVRFCASSTIRYCLGIDRPRM